MNKMRKLLRGVRIFAGIEIMLGSVTLLAVTASLVTGISAKPYNVLIFVILSSCISLIVGLGIWVYNPTARSLLLYFASVIILSKLLLFFKIIWLSGELETTIPSSLKNTISLFYHLCIVWYFNQKSVRGAFIARTP